jgi:NAD(P)-dependent dehydrogenase (short-subunit alcohol dehydrogenase family)
LLASHAPGETIMRLEGKGAIVTGAARGIGKAIADRFAAEGAYVVLADVDAAAGDEARAAIVERGGFAHFVRADVGDAQAAGALVDAALEWAGRLDVLVNNAGIIKSADFLELSEADFDAVLRVNLKGAFLVGQAAARAMVARGGGAIINMSSINGRVAIANQTPYNVSKGGLDQLTRVMALALADKGVRVNAIAPGSILTDMLETVMTDDAARRTILSRTPMGRCGAPDEVAKVAVFLASDESSYVTGEIVTVDGGRMTLNYTVSVPD